MLHNATAKLPSLFLLRAHSLRAARILLGALALATASRLTLQFFGTPVPFTVAPQVVLLVAALLGPSEGVAAVLSWLGAGLCGAPVFASGLVGAAAFVGPSAGFMMGYVPAAFLVGHVGCGHSRPAAIVPVAAVWLLASAVILGCGALGIARIFGLPAMWPVAIAPFVVADACKAMLALVALRTLTRIGRAQNN